MKRINKQLTFYALLALIVIGLAYPTALATDRDLPETLLTESFETDDPGIPDDGQYEMHQVDESIDMSWMTTAYVTFAEWEKFGYPDDIGGVYSLDGGSELGFLVVNPSQQRINELHELLGYNAVITPCKYSYNELKLVQQEITDMMSSSSNSGIYSSGLGWISTNGVVHGFGDSSKEFRVTVSVDESVFDHYNDGFTNRYGDRVVVEIGFAISTDDSMDGGMWPGGGPQSGGGGLEGGGSMASGVTIVPIDISGVFIGSDGGSNVGGGWNPLLWVVIGACLLCTLALFLWLRLRPAPAIQTANGGIITERAALTNRQVVAAVKDSGSEPGEQVFQAIIKRIDNHEK